ncbi:hypothetical protein B0H14DRAFT_2748646, partial [Mycena olivaceomarginata]
RCRSTSTSARRPRTTKARGRGRSRRHLCRGCTRGRRRRRRIRGRRRGSGKESRLGGNGSGDLRVACYRLAPRHHVTTRPLLCLVSALGILYPFTRTLARSSRPTHDPSLSSPIIFFFFFHFAYHRKFSLYVRSQYIAYPSFLM